MGQSVYNVKNIIFIPKIWFTGFPFGGIIIIVHIIMYGVRNNFRCVSLLYRTSLIMRLFYYQGMEKRAFFAVVKTPA